MFSFTKKTAEPIAAAAPLPPAKPTQLELARSALASAEQALATARSKDTEARRQLAALNAQPPAATVESQVAIEAQRNALRSVLDQVRREASDADALVGLRRSELTATLERATQARAQLTYRQKHLDERRLLLDRMLTARPALEALASDATWRTLPTIYQAATTILTTIASLAQDVQLYTEDVRKLQAQVGEWGEV